MRKRWIVGMVVTFVLGVLAGAFAKKPGTDPALFAGKPPKEAAAALLTVARAQAEKGSWENIAVGRVYYLSGQKAEGQAIFDSVTSKKSEGGDWIRVGRVYYEAGSGTRRRPFSIRFSKSPPRTRTGWRRSAPTIS